MEDEKQIDLGDLIDKAIDSIPAPTPQVVRLMETKVRLIVGGHGAEAVRTHAALRHMGDIERQTFLKALLNHWYGASYNYSEREPHLAQLHKVFGENTETPFGQRLLYTLTTGGNQLRCWYGIPGHMTGHHVDSCGEGLLWEVVGEPVNVQKYVESVIHYRTRRDAVNLPNGTVVYGFFFD